MSKPTTLDRIDLKILKTLEQDGRISFQRLSEQVNLTPRPCLERVRRLEKLGIISGYTAVIQWPDAPPFLVMWVQVSLTDHVNAMNAFTNEVINTPIVLECWMLQGTFDLLIRIGCSSMNEYVDVAERWLKNRQLGIEKITTMTELRVIKRPQHANLLQPSQLP